MAHVGTSLKMLILVTNDDGIKAPALMPLKHALDTIAETLLIAPDKNWSASGHPKTLHKPLRADRIKLADGTEGFVSTAPPPDCVALALLGLTERRPEMVVSGINHGSNLGFDVFYSGTVAAAVEGVIEGLPAIAFSRKVSDHEMGSAVTEELDAKRLEQEIDYAPIAAFCARLAQQVMIHGLPPHTFLNVNFPNVPWAEIKGIEFTRLGRRVYRDELVRRQDPRGRPYYWIGGLPPKGIADPGTDIWAVENNLISITPLNLDMTASDQFNTLKQWKL